MKQKLGNFRQKLAKSGIFLFANRPLNRLGCEINLFPAHLWKILSPWSDSGPHEQLQLLHCGSCIDKLKKGNSKRGRPRIAITFGTLMKCQWQWQGQGWFSWLVRGPSELEGRQFDPCHSIDVCFDFRRKGGKRCAPRATNLSVQLNCHVLPSKNKNLYLNDCNSSRSFTVCLNSSTYS